jgi:hypothetical protein
MVFPPQGVGKTKVRLSDIEIDVDKDWNGKKIVNIAEIQIE